MAIEENSLILIPARYASTRFPGKPLVDIAGKPMVQHVYEKAAAVAAHVYVATDDERIYDAVLAFGGRAVMTSDAHRSGTDRCYEAYTKVKEMLQCNFDVVVNVQGDEPFIIPEQIESLITCFEDPAVQIATLAKPFEKNDEIFDPNKVKVVFSTNHTALYFSRNPIPYCRARSVIRIRRKFAFLFWCSDSICVFCPPVRLFLYFVTRAPTRGFYAFGVQRPYWDAEKPTRGRVSADGL